MLDELPYARLPSPGSARTLIEACAREIRPLWIRYTGGSSPGRQRLILPAPPPDSLPHVPERIFPAWCRLRCACRTFRFDRIAACVDPGPDDWRRFPFYHALGELDEYLLDYPSIHHPNVVEYS